MEREPNPFGIENDIEDVKTQKENSDIIDSKITNEKELAFIINYLKNSSFI